MAAVTAFPRAALVIAHPGHELRVHGWLELARPLVFVLTDGSGRTGRSRLDATSGVLQRCGARPGSIYGRLTDRELYRALLDGRHGLFAGLAEELAAALRQEAAVLVAGDAVEGFNPGHDVTRLLLNAAVAGLRAGGAAIDNRDFPLDGPPASGAAAGADAASGNGGAIRIRLDPPALARKLAAARAYPGLEDEVARALAQCGPSAFETEWLREVRYGLELDALVTEPPFYETYGERQVAAGFFREVVRYRAHVAPLADHLRSRFAAPPLAEAAGARAARGAGGTGAEIAAGDRR